MTCVVGENGCIDHGRTVLYLGEEFDTKNPLQVIMVQNSCEDGDSVGRMTSGIYLKIHHSSYSGDIVTGSCCETLAMVLSMLLGVTIDNL